jgi:hypothetical protein
MANLDMEKINAGIAERSDVFYWQTDRAVEPEDAGHIWADRHRYFTDGELVETVNTALGEDISFDYPGDGTGFFANRERKMTSEGIKLVAANNDQPLQQIGIIGGLAAMSEMVLEQS